MCRVVHTGTQPTVARRRRVSEPEVSHTSYKVNNHLRLRHHLLKAQCLSTSDRHLTAHLPVALDARFGVLFAHSAPLPSVQVVLRMGGNHAVRRRPCGASEHEAVGLLVLAQERAI